MMQFYFLSVAANLLGGLLLLAERFGERFPSLGQLHELLGRRWSRGVLGALAFLTGFIKLLLGPTPGDVRFFGDLLPALMGLALGAGLLLPVALEKSPESSRGRLGDLSRLLGAYRAPLGAAAVVVAVLHFLVPGALLL